MNTYFKDQAFRAAVHSLVTPGATTGPSFAIVSGSFNPPNLAAQSNANVSGTVTGVATGDALIYLHGIGNNWSNLTVDAVVITGANTVEITVGNYGSVANDATATDVYFLHVSGL